MTEVTSIILKILLHYKNIFENNEKSIIFTTPDDLIYVLQGNTILKGENYTEFGFKTIMEL